ncbi:hypothetical protein CWN85_11210 [Vibrio splendidus]|uniref:hypothetical protein n=1 Tax=Vibrio TaxID=662 RepID=UPI000D34B38B|nr:MULTISPECIES: hypothetical protein [Vibrio]PTP08766.1 hypothetical protein CWN86_08005 [Vibrio splendidus]PTP23627.1 hypothetical protein CWN85_11210 [Vibrio splendidus]RLQ17147.1 hypothetical protein AYK60_18750 [Vibrio sp. SBT000027]
MTIFESDITLEKQLVYLDTLTIYTALQGEFVEGDNNHFNTSFNVKERHVYKIDVFNAETTDSHFIKLFITQIAAHSKSSGWTLKDTYPPSLSSIENVFSVTVSKTDEVVRFGPKGNLGMLDTNFKNRGIGRFCMSYLVNTLLNKGFGHYLVASPSLAYKDAETNEKKRLRNNFYQKSGFKFENIDIEDGSCSAGSVDTLCQSYNRKKVKLLKTDSIARVVIRELKNQEERETALKWDLKSSIRNEESATLKSYLFKSLLYLSIMGNILMYVGFGVWLKVLFISILTLLSYKSVRHLFKNLRQFFN